MSGSREPMIFINWREVHRRWSRLGFVLVAGLYYLAILALVLETLRIALYAFHLPAPGRTPWHRMHVASLVGLVLAAVWFLSLVRKQRRAREWSPLLTVFVLSMMSYVTFRSTEPRVMKPAIPPLEVQCGSETQTLPAARPAVLRRR